MGGKGKGGEAIIIEKEVIIDIVGKGKGKGGYYGGKKSGGYYGGKKSYNYYAGGKGKGKGGEAIIIAKEEVIIGKGKGGNYYGGKKTGGYYGGKKTYYRSGVSRGYYGGKKGYFSGKGKGKGANGGFGRTVENILNQEYGRQSVPVSSPKRGWKTRTIDSVKDLFVDEESSSTPDATPWSDTTETVVSINALATTSSAFPSSIFSRVKILATTIVELFSLYYCKYNRHYETVVIYLFVPIWTPYCTLEFLLIYCVDNIIIHIINK